MSARHRSWGGDGSGERARTVAGRAFALGTGTLLGGLLVIAPVAGTAQEKESAPPQAASPASTAAAAANPEGRDFEELRQRTAKFWAARIAGDFNTQFELLEPRGRGRMTASEFAARKGPIKYMAYEVAEAVPSTTNDHFAWVKVRLLVQPVVPTSPNKRIPPQVSVIGDRWVRVGAVWYRSLEQGQEEGQWPSQ